MLKIQNKKYDVITLDFETYYESGSDAYTLKNKKSNLSEYIRDARFKAHGVGIKKNGAKTKWYTGAAIATAIQAINWNKAALLCHNTYFDGFILSQHYNVVAAFYLDTMLMAKGAHGVHTPAGLDYLARLHGLAGKVKAGALVNTVNKRELTKQELKDLGLYCIDDCDDTYALFERLHDHIPDDELRLIDITLRMWCDPVLSIDAPRIQAEYEREVQEKADALAFVSSLCTVKDLQSNEKFAELLRAQDSWIPMKVSPATGEPTYAFAKTDLEFIDLMENGSPVVQALCSARVRNKTSTNETRALRFLEAGKKPWKFPVYLNYCGAHTFRWSGGAKMNVQNLMRGGELRRSLCAPKGHVIVVADSAQIEARVLAWLAGEDRILHAFASGQDVYKLQASGTYGKPVEEIDKTERFVGKVCLSQGSLIYSDRGWIPIETLTPYDKLWDGEEWACHQGLLNNGLKKTGNLSGLWLTPDHLILSGNEWKEAQYLAQDENSLCLALVTAAGTLRSPDILKALEAERWLSSSNAIAAQESIELTTTALRILEALDAIPAQKKPRRRNGTGFMRRLCQMTCTVAGYLTGWLPQSPAATTQTTQIINTTDYEGSLYATNGETIEQLFSRIYRLYMVGIFRCLKWTGLIITKDTNPEISTSSLAQTTCETGVELKTWKPGFENSNMCWRPVYDVINVGRNNRFMALTSRGPVIVHNCVLGLGFGMGGQKFMDTLAKGAMGPKLSMPLSEAKFVVNSYRKSNANIVKFWSRAEAILIDMIVGREGTYGPLSWGKGYIRMPNGMFMQYHDLTGEIYEDRYGRMRLKDAHYSGKRGIKSYIYGGLATENWVQCLARCIVAEQMLVISEQYRIITMSHDEIVVLAPKKDAKKCLAFMIKTMSTSPSWCLGLPLGAEGGYDVVYSK